MWLATDLHDTILQETLDAFDFSSFLKLKLAIIGNSFGGCNLKETGRIPDLYTKISRTLFIHQMILKTTRL